MTAFLPRETAGGFACRKPDPTPGTMVSSDRTTARSHPSLLWWLIPATIVAPLILHSALPATRPSVQITVRAPEFAEYSFPKGQPPVRGKEFDGKEAGYCDTTYSCDLQINVQYPKEVARATATVTSVEFTIGSRITVWVQEGASADVHEHENTHRAISEHYYYQSNAVAETIARGAVGRKLILDGRAVEGTVNAAIKTLQSELLDEFMRRTHRRSAYAQERFDLITAHGRDNISNADAMKRALREEADHWAIVGQIPVTASK